MNTERYIKSINYDILRNEDKMNELQNTIKEFGENGNYNSNEINDLSLWIDNVLSNEKDDLEKDRNCCLNTKEVEND